MRITTLPTIRETSAFVLTYGGFEKIAEQAFDSSAKPFMCLDIRERASESPYMGGD